MSIGSIDPIALLVAYRRQIVGKVHTQDIEQVLTGKFTECLSAHLLDDVLQSDEVQATINPVGLRFVSTLAGRDVLHHSLRTRRTILFFQLCRRAIRRKAGSVCQQISYTDGLLFLTVFAYPILEFRDIHIDGIAQTNLATFHQNPGTDSC